ncbi:hypothetical protein Tco_1343043 [Tanacetum coccineum]
MFKRRLIAADQASVFMEMMSVHISSGLVLHQMTSDHNRSELGIQDHSNEQSSSKLVPKVVPKKNLLDMSLGIDNIYIATRTRTTKESVRIKDPTFELETLLRDAFESTELRFQVTPKASHLNAVKRIFRYLKHQPKLGLWYPRDSPFRTGGRVRGEAFLDSDYKKAPALTGNQQQVVVNFLVED